MPIYEYRCDRCGHEFEIIQKMSDDPLTDCPDCGEAGLRKLVSAAGFQLKGSGWYVTDFRDKKKGGGEARKGDQGKKKSEGDGAKSGESKPAAADAKPKAAKAE